MKILFYICIPIFLLTLFGSCKTPIENQVIKNNLFSGTIRYVTDEKPVPDATIRIRNTDIGTGSRTDGTFELLIPEQYLQKKNIEFEITTTITIPLIIECRTTEIPANKDIYIQEQSKLLFE